MNACDGLYDPQNLKHLQPCPAQKRPADSCSEVHLGKVTSDFRRQNDNFCDPPGETPKAEMSSWYHFKELAESL